MRSSSSSSSLSLYHHPLPSPSPRYPIRHLIGRTRFASSLSSSSFARRWSLTLVLCICIGVVCTLYLYSLGLVSCIYGYYFSLLSFSLSSLDDPLRLSACNFYISFDPCGRHRSSTCVRYQNGSKRGCSVLLLYSTFVRTRVP